MPTMNIQEAAHSLGQMLKQDSNVQTIGIAESNAEAYDKHPQWFTSRTTEDVLFVYTYRKPTKKELELTYYEGFQVKWRRIGYIVPA